jgi:A/G-specific adenine glycosylase
MTHNRYKSLHSTVIAWYKKNGRDLPWRNTRNPYRILISEVMLQQTQVSRVTDFYKRWLQRFPTIASLARAPKNEVLKVWSGMGYNNRAIRLHTLAKIVTESYNGKLPQSPSALEQLPGVGKYTSHAIACFAFGASLPVVDINVRRIFSRMCWKVTSPLDLRSDRIIWSRASELLPARHVFEWNQALMDIGSQICTSRNPDCNHCPVNTFCASAFTSALAKKVPRIQKNEPSFNGIPRRIVRGAIVKLLHTQTHSPKEIQQHLKKEVVSLTPAALLKILQLLQRDGVVTLQTIRGRIRVSLSR